MEDAGCTLNLSPGTRVGVYEVMALLGAGGMGEVYRARDTRLERMLALKPLPRQLAGDPKRRQRFEREAQAISQLNHPHICTLHDVGEAAIVRPEATLASAATDAVPYLV